MFKFLFSKSDEELKKEMELQKEKERIMSCSHEMENISTGTTMEYITSHNGLEYVSGGVAYTIIRCKKACGFTRKIMDCSRMG